MNPASPIFLLACGQRCGSTLMQRLLNTHPQVLIWGEHSGSKRPGLVRHLRLAARGMEIAAKHDGGDEHYLEFRRHGADIWGAAMMPPVDRRALLRNLLLNLFAEPAAQACGRTLWGFKETRYTANDALFLQELFPGCRIIFLYRNPRASYLSMRRLPSMSPFFSVVGFATQWRKIARSFLDQAPLIDHLLVIDYDHFITAPTHVIRDMAAFLGLAATDFDSGILMNRRDGNSTSAVITPNPEEEYVIQALTTGIMTHLDALRCHPPMDT